MAGTGLFDATASRRPTVEAWPADRFADVPCSPRRARRIARKENAVSPVRLAYMPLLSYPESPPDDAVEAALALATSLQCALSATAFAVDMPSVPLPVGGMLLNMPEMNRMAEQHSQARCRDLKSLLREKAGRNTIGIATRHAGLGRAEYGAALEARTFDVVLLPWSRDGRAVRDFSQTVVFEAGRPCILVPPGTPPTRIGHVAVAWDAGRVAARALADALPLLGEDCRITVLTVEDNKTLPAKGLADSLAAALQRRGHRAEARTVALGGRKIAVALQEAALLAGAEMLVMGGFGHSRIRDMVLGGATTGVFDDLRLPVLMSH
jgi:nucleotide-binding universal stress UspA family protein